MYLIINPEDADDVKNLLANTYGLRYPPFGLQEYSVWHLLCTDDKSREILRDLRNRKIKYKTV